MRTILALLLCTTIAYADPVVVVTEGMDLPQTVTTSEGTYIIIPNYSTGKPMAVVQTTKSDSDSQKKR